MKTNRNFHIRFLTAFLLAVCLCDGAFATVEQAAVEAKEDLSRSTRNLAALREQIRKEKIPLSKEYTRFKNEVLVQRRELEKVFVARDNRSLELSALEQENTSKLEELNYIENLLFENLRNFESRIDVSEIQVYDDALSKIKKTVDQPGMSRGAKIDALIEVVNLSLERFEHLLGGDVFSGNAISAENGVEDRGEFLRYGPLTYFASSRATGVFGLSQTGLALEPNIYSIPNVQELIEQTIKNEAGNLPIDVTLGDALSLVESEETVVEHLQKGGVWIYPILGLAALSILIAIIKFIEIFSVKKPKAQTVASVVDALKAGRLDEATKLVANIPGRFGAMLQDAVKYHHLHRDLLDEVLFEHILTARQKLERMLPFLSVTAASTPLLGLLGTVTGMIHTFRLIAVYGTGDAGPLSEGISEALITTEYGLIVAIPTLMMHAFLHRRTLGILAEMDKLALAFQNALPGGRAQG